HERLTDLDEYTYFTQIVVAAHDETVALIASAGRIPPRVISYHPERGVRIHRRGSAETVALTAHAQPQPISWTGHDGDAVHGLYYPPTSERFTGVGLPPLLVYIHGGPTSQTQARYEPVHQYFATRGLAVLAVNHRGSTGYGRAYARQLYGQWGYYDVEDAASGVAHLVAQGLAAAGQAAIMGGSAGGYTVLQSLVDKPGVYRAGVCLYGISSHFGMETHKFEERYTALLLGDLPAAAALYRQRSPLYHADRIRDPLILFQGAEDNVVPRSQSDLIVAALAARANPVAHEYHVYDGEGHGFTQPATIEAYLLAALRFLQQHVVNG
ncbi:MAG: S9 family peptidase, partial [Armatimonadetes bacterium]|nr:S9 family peptidase [Anaerolineae bacterium]